MALVNCIECNHEISDLAASCPQCGAPAAGAEGGAPADTQVQTIQATSKKFKAQILVAAVMASIGIALGAVEATGTKTKPEDMWGGTVFLIGVVWILVTYARIWWNHK